MYRKYLVIILLLFGITSCKQEEDITKSPAEEQIQEYTKQLEDCKDDEQKDSKEDITEIKQAPPPVRNFSIAEDDMVLGNPKSKVVVIEYFSPTCPHCVRYHKKTYPEIKAKYIDTNKIAYVPREFIANKQDLVASILARCRGDISSYLKFIDVILTQQESWIFDKNFQQILTNIGQVGGISPEEFAACLTNEDKIKSLMENTKLATKAPRFIGTPSFFINGEHFTKPYTTEELSKEIERNLIEAQ